MRSPRASIPGAARSERSSSTGPRAGGGLACDRSGAREKRCTS
ncbi:hypothetical protein [Siccirubricoccus sp. G192]|nr:hypothetical protein [Siccirubricoccus sp. G192]